MASSTDRAKEAEKQLAEAKKCLKTGLLKWSPDYDNAANHFEKAAMCFRNLRNHKRAIDAYEQAAEAYLNSNALFHSAKSLEQAANVARDARMLEQSGQLFQTSSERYNESGHPDTAALILEKAAKMLQHENPVVAAGFFLQAADLSLVQDRNREAALRMKDALRMYCRDRQSMDQIIQFAQKSREFYLKAEMVDCAFEAVAVELVAILHTGSIINAREVFQEAERKVTSFARSEWDGLLDRLLEACEQQDTEEISSCCNAGHFKALDPEFAKLARDLEGGTPLPTKQAGAKKTPTSSGNSKTGSSSSAGKVPVGKNDPKALADMRSQLFSKSSKSDSKGKQTKPQQKSRLDTPPESEHEEPAAEAEKPKAAALLDQSEQSQDTLESEAQSEEKLTGSAGGHDDEDEDEPLDIN